MKGRFGLALLVATAVNVALPSAASSRTSSAEAVETTAYPRIGRADMHLILLGHAATTWSDEQLSEHVFGAPPSDLDQFSKRDHHEAMRARAAQIRTLIQEMRGMGQFRLGVLSVSMPYPSTQKVLGMTGDPPRRFRSFGGYTEDDASAHMRLMPYNFDTSSFVLSAPFLPCDGGWQEELFGSNRSLAIGYKIRNWASPGAADGRTPQQPPTARCDMRIEDERAARRIEDARHRGRLAIGATVYARISGEMDDKQYVLIADRVDIHFFRNEGGVGVSPRLATVTLLAPTEPPVTDAPEASHGPSSGTGSRGLDLSDSRQVEACAAMGALTQTIAEQAATAGIPARQTEAYATTRQHVGEMADAVVVVVDRLGDRMKPHLMRSWSMYGYCHGMEDDLLFGEAASKVAATCNQSADELSGRCIQELLKGNFEALAPAEQERLREAARQRGY
ncbi:hypothetical protein E2F46_06915 [Luteimonas aestuarii]|uniref:Uncharacterized protein n=1 Tax=Luteimonas aestuarii TaxID=453837 RepID=A0A4R5TYM7_9GAMM|nr:hypothetical protein [Luteimonas aestuarii]TDK26310.1 hypothetical protein E2F46_06915 [Luteimonas aestuarii]